MSKTLHVIIIMILTFSVYAQKKDQNLVLSNIDVQKPRNIIFILTDDHRYDFIGFTGRISWLKTPNMDRLYHEGAWFKNAFVTTSLCSPSRASILTGSYSHVHTIVDNEAPEPPGLIYFPQYLQKAGYQTSFFGKWHMGNGDDGPRPGFEHWESFKGQGVYYNPTLNIDGKEVAYTDSTYITDLLTDHALTWLKKQGINQSPSFYICHTKQCTHLLNLPGVIEKGRVQKSGIMYCRQPIIKRSMMTIKNWAGPNGVKQQRYSWHGVDYMYHTHIGIDELVRTYCETLLAVDESIGELMDYLKKEGLDKNTLIIYMGDNGFAFGEHGLIDKRTFYEESVKVPLLVYCPELFNGGQTINKMVHNIDIAPTILEIAGLVKPAGMPGKSFIPLLKGDSTMWRDKIFYEYFWEYDFPMTPTTYGVRTDKYKYIHYMGIWDTNELYDLEKDPNETTNLIARPEYTGTIKKLSGYLFDWLQQTGGMQIPLKRTIKHPSGDYRTRTIISC